MPSEVERSARLIGQVHALKAFAGALATSHPNPGLLKADFEESSQVAQATLENSIMPEVALREFQGLCAHLMKLLDEKKDG